MKMGKVRLLGGVATFALMVSAGIAHAQDANADLAARLQADEDKLAADHARLSTLEQNFNYATWTFDNGRPVLTTGDGRFSMAFRIRFQSDFAGFSQDATHPTG